MGHLVNPVSIRLGWVYSWENLYFCNHLYYPQMLHIVYQFKLYLKSCLRRHFFEIQIGVLFSHCDFIHVGRFFSIVLFSYQSSLESLVQEFITKSFWFLKYLIPNKKLSFRISFAQKTILFLLLSGISCWNPDFQLQTLLDKIWPERLMKFLINSLSERDFYSVIYRLKSFGKVPKYVKARFFIFYYIFQKFLQKYHFTWWDGLIEFCYCYLSSFGLKEIFIVQSSHLQLIAKFIFKLNIKVSWVRITNDEIRSEFLAWYLAYKFKQHFTVSSLAKPIRRELNMMAFSLHSNNIDRLRNFPIQTTFQLRYLLLNAYLCFTHYFYNEWVKHFLLNKTWIILDYFNFLKILRKKFLKKIKIINFTLRLIKLFAWVQLISLPCSLFIVRFVLNNQFFFAYYNAIIINYFNNDIIFELSESKNFFCYYLTNSLLLFNKFMNTWWIENCNQLVPMLKVNKLRTRQSLTNRPELFGLTGFKLHFAGRFSRKQRASSISIHHGRLPLNSIKTNIEYSMHTNVAKNSTICVKVWFYYTNFIYTGHSLFLVPEDIKK